MQNKKWDLRKKSMGFKKEINGILEWQVGNRDMTYTYSPAPEKSGKKSDKRYIPTSLVGTYQIGIKKSVKLGTY